MAASLARSARMLALRRAEAGALAFSARSAPPSLPGVIDAAGRDFLAAGAGGRCSPSGVAATVFGATGFLGRYVVNELGRIGSRVIVPYRCQARLLWAYNVNTVPCRLDAGDADHVLPVVRRRLLTTPPPPYSGRRESQEQAMTHLKVTADLGMVQPVPWDLRDEVGTRRAVARSNVVINLVGAEKETWNWRYEEVHVDHPARLARLCSEPGSGVDRLVHVSAMGASADAPSKRLRTLAAGEAAVRDAFPDATIIRLAPVVGPEDRFFNRMARLVTGSPRVPLVDGGVQLVQPVWVTDVARGLQRALEHPESRGKTYEFAGPRAMSMADVHALVTEITREQPKAPLAVPSAILVPIAGAVESFMHSAKLPTYMMNPWFTGDGALDAARDQTPGASGEEGLPGLVDLGIEPRSVTEGRPPEHLRFYRAGGYHKGATVLDAHAEGTR